MSLASASANPSHSGADVVVIGGGLHGLSSAVHLARAGARVTVLEAEYCGRHASGVNAGGVRTLGRHIAEIPLALESRALWHRLPELVDDSGGFMPSGQLKVAESEAELETLRARVADLHQRGFTHETLVDAATVRDLLPAVAPHVTGGIWVADDGHALPFRTVTAFRRAAERLGVIVHEDARVTAVERMGEHWAIDAKNGRFTAEYVVNAAGAWAGEFARQIGEPVPEEPVALLLTITHRVPPFCSPVVGATGRPLSFKQFDNGTVLIGGGVRGRVDMPSRAGEVDFAQLASNARTALDLFPHLRDVGINRTWAGIEGFMPDGIPVIGPSRTAPKAVHAFGFSAHGFELGPVVGRIVAELITAGRSTLPIEPFAIERFVQRAIAPTVPVAH
ncbi:sarcosine oxidase subunit beta [Trinickia symbiotica]|uniref:FAD-binding oxidoreductase n=1 Tax=Trinickia symbiotica TaxID=863227 RepID=A0A2N7X0L3_9BURK|nr:FAD-binding oxidoreductase [Trinickia symbiotica]PMS35276.1 FAD-binding oxidoreductase [Trinickia symbiotica]PPK43842.1 sarcosine oxidase subunit beta [Trinickia symbiotica]